MFKNKVIVRSLLHRQYYAFTPDIFSSDCSPMSSLSSFDTVLHPSLWPLIGPLAISSQKENNAKSNPNRPRKTILLTETTNTMTSFKTPTTTTALLGTACNSSSSTGKYNIEKYDVLCGRCRGIHRRFRLLISLNIPRYLACKGRCETQPCDSFTNWRTMWYKHNNLYTIFQATKKQRRQQW